MLGENNFSNPLVPAFIHPINTSQHLSGLFSVRATTTTVFVLNIIAIQTASAGIIANITNVVVFSKQGFKENINISLTCLTISDLAMLIFILWQTLTFLPTVRNADWPFSPSEFAYFTGSLPRVYFSRTSSLITVYIASERCVSVLKPLQVKFLFTRKRLIFSIAGICCLNTLHFIPIFYTSRFVWKSHPLTNRTYLGVVFLKSSQIMNDIFMMFAVVMLFFTFISVAVGAVILVSTLYKHSRWRVNMSTTITPTPSQPDEQTVTVSGQSTAEGIARNTNKNKSKSSRKDQDDRMSGKGSAKNEIKKAGSSMSDRDKRAAKTVSLLAIIFVLCYFPSVLCQITMLAGVDFNRAGRYRNAYTIFWLISMQFESVCASINVFVYFNTSTKFRDTLLSFPFSKSKN